MKNGKHNGTKHKRPKSYSTITSLSPLGLFSPKSKTMRPALAYLTPQLPGGWENFFSIRRAGRYWGLSIVCPHCGEKPPKEIRSHSRWRWLSTHIAKHNTAQYFHEFVVEQVKEAA